MLDAFAKNLNLPSFPFVGDCVGSEGLHVAIDANRENGEHQVLWQLLLPSKHGDVIWQDVMQPSLIGFGLLILATITVVLEMEWFWVLYLDFVCIAYIYMYPI